MTSGSLTTAPPHPVAQLVSALGGLLDEHGAAPTWSLTPADLTDLLPALATAKRRLDALELRLLAEADRHQVGDPLGAANTAGWWANATRTTKPAAHRQVRLAGRLDDAGHAATTDAMNAGAVSTEQAAVILDAVDALPSEIVEPAVKAEAEAHLVALAEHHDPKELRFLGRRILEVVAPEVAEEHERKFLEGEEQRARETASLTMNPDGHGSMVGRFKIPVLVGQMLARHLEALAAPKHRAAVEGTAGEKVGRPLRLGQAFIEYVETRRDAPKAGGIAATVVVTMTMDALLGADTVATLDTGDRITAGEARRLACEAGIIPAVLGGKSQVLDLGRKTRFHTEAQRIVLGRRDGGCTAEGCDWPPGMCHAHHGIPWSRGGPTDIEHGRLLCPRHHTLAHDARYQMKTGKNGKVTFSRRT
ncbi:DUF222 domain-containing protein [Marmoricola sp. RAF53]|uniref:HNH endonuclease signature motif containing protein n=1 Tax=Marmoricola sp. RAF53 TaxID=3233059 RepID=UPI003F95E268